MLSLSLHTGTNHMYGCDACFSISCGELHLPQHLPFVYLWKNFATSGFDTIHFVNEFERRSEIRITARYIQLLSASAVLGAAGGLSCPEIPKQCLLK